MRKVCALRVERLEDRNTPSGEVVPVPVPPPDSTPPPAEAGSLDSGAELVPPVDLSGSQYVSGPYYTDPGSSLLPSDPAAGTSGTDSGSTTDASLPTTYFQEGAYCY